MSDTEVWLFSYGTLRLPEVQLALFGRLIEEEADALVGYELAEVEIADPDVLAKSGIERHPIIRWSGADGLVIEGAALRLEERDLEAADAYETSADRRVTARLRSGREAFVYVEA